MSNSRFCTVVMLVAVCCVLHVQGEMCRSENRAVDFSVEKRQVKMLLSPGFPKPYDRNQDCNWFLLNQRSANYSIQIAVMEMDLDGSDGDCNDKLEIYTGSSRKTMRRIPSETWCGSDVKKIFTTREPYVRLRLSTDGHFGGRGFALEYGLIRQNYLQCSERPHTIKIENVPVFANFIGSDTMNSCKWRVKANSNLMFEIYKPSQILCDVGKFVFYEGDHESKHRNFEFCSNDKAFSKIYFASDVVNVVLNHTSGSRFDEEDNLMIKMYQQKQGSKCNATKEVSHGPVMFSLPKLNVNNPCTTVLQTKDPSRGLRLDVMGENEEKAICHPEDDYIDVIDKTNNIRETPKCSRSHPVYRAGSRMQVTSRREHDTVFLRASSIGMMCNGHQTQLNAVPNKVKKSSLPEGKGYINLSYCQADIWAAGDDDVIALTLRWQRPADSDFEVSNNVECLGDFVRVYEKLKDNRIHHLNSTCQASSDDIVVKVISNTNRVQVVLDADKEVEGPSVMMEYYSIPGRSQCPRNITASDTPVEMKSALYPQAPPLNHYCKTILTAEKEGDQIVVSLLDSNLANDCSSMLTIYEGDDNENPDEMKAVKRVCGKTMNDTHDRFTIYGGKGVLVTQSRDSRGPGGWHVEVYSMPSGSAGIAPGVGIFLTLLLATFHLL